VMDVACEHAECNRIVARDGKCIFHLDSKNQSETEEFNSRLLDEIKNMQADTKASLIDLKGFRFPGPVYKPPSETRFHKAIDFRYVVFEGKADFSQTEFSADAYFDNAKFSSDAFFIESKFSGAAAFRDVKFSGDAFFHSTKFSRHACFDGVQISGNTSFERTEFSFGMSCQHAEFSGDTQFNYAKFFSGHAEFGDAKFSRHASLCGVKFSGPTFFARVKFSASASFDDTQFSGDTFFHRAKFSENASFERAEFLGYSYFDYVEFSGDASFDSSKVAGLLTFKATIFQTTDHQIQSPIDRYTHFKEIKVGPHGEVRFEGGICMSRVSFYYTDIQRFSFLDVKWGRLGGRTSIIEHGILEERKQRSRVLPDITPEHVQQIYVRLRRNLERGAGRYPEAGDFFINEKEMRKLILQEATGWPRLENMPEWFILKAYGSLARYGESIMLPIYWGLVIVVGLWPLRALSFRLQTTDAKPYFDFLMESVMAFFQMRSEPGLDILERLISIPILGSLFIAFKRKFERR